MCGHKRVNRGVILMLIETQRLYLRELTEEDYPSLCRILQDEETMYAYEGAYTAEEVQGWLERQLARYEKLLDSKSRLLKMEEPRPSAELIAAYDDQRTTVTLHRHTRQVNMERACKVILDSTRHTVCIVTHNSELLIPRIVNHL